MSKLNAKGSTGDKNIMLNAELIKIILEALIRFVLASRAAFFDTKCRLGPHKIGKDKDSRNARIYYSHGLQNKSVETL